MMFPFADTLIGSMAGCGVVTATVNAGFAIAAASSAAARLEGCMANAIVTVEITAMATAATKERGFLIIMFLVFCTTL
jgi:hypothetical protein